MAAMAAAAAAVAAAAWPRQFGPGRDGAGSRIQFCFTCIVDRNEVGVGKHGTRRLPDELTGALLFAHVHRANLETTTMRSV